jgi:hypothetical protein
MFACADRKFQQLEYETNALKEKANDDAEGLTSTMDSMRRELLMTERRLGDAVEALRLSKLEVEAMNEEISARDKVLLLSLLLLLLLLLLCVCVCAFLVAY